jgi:hypothetical protein
MKIAIKTVVVLTFILILVAIQSRNTSHRGKYKYKSNTKEGCKIAVYDVKIYVGEQSPVDATFEATINRVPVENSSRGWIFTIPTKPTLGQASAFIQIADTSEYYIPYRKLSTKFEGITPSEGAGRYITNIIHLGDTQHNLKIEFKYDPNWDYVSDKDFKNLNEWLNINRENNIKYVSELKRQAIGLAAKFVSDSKSAEAAGKGVEGITKEIADFNDRITYLKNENTKLESGSQFLHNDILLNQGLVSKAEGVLKIANVKVETINAEISRLEKINAEKQQDINDKTLPDKIKYETQFKNAYSDIINIFSTYRDECTNTAGYFDKAIEALDTYPAGPDSTEIQVKTKNNFIGYITKAFTENSIMSIII